MHQWWFFDQFLHILCNLLLRHLSVAATFTTRMFMGKTFLHCCLVLLLSLQPFWAMADEHASGTQDFAPQIAEHQDSHSEKHPQHTVECQHCCHCHSQQSQLPATSQHNNSQQYAYTLGPDSLKPAPRDAHNPSLYRPPIV